MLAMLSFGLTLHRPPRSIAAVTDILPDDTWLTELTLRQRRPGMAGRSTSAARLTGLLSADPTINDTAFAAPARVVPAAAAGGAPVQPPPGFPRVSPGTSPGAPLTASPGASGR